MGQGKGFGKVILFNEHFVVYGIPSIVSAIGDYTTVKVIRQEAVSELEAGEIFIKDNRPETPGYKSSKVHQQKRSLELMLKHAHARLGSNALMVELGGDLLTASGIGASAASCAGFARALNEEFALDMDDKAINRTAYEGEKAYHGTPSGVDNTAATYGGLIQFTKGKISKFRRIKIPNPVEIVMGNTGLVTDTKNAVAGVKKRKEKHLKKYARIFKEARKLAPLARSALEAGDLRTIGKLMFEDHRLLREIEVSCSELDHLVDIARTNGAYGAKMTGGGLGGYMVALTPGQELQDKVADAIADEGVAVLRTKIGVKNES